MEASAGTRAAALHLWARLGGDPLDAELAAGINPARSPYLSARAEQITRAGARRRLAAGIRAAVEAAAEPFREPTSRVPLDRSAIDSCRDELLALATMVESTPRPRARGVAIARRLLLDGRSPLYGGWGRGRGQGRLESFVANAINALRVSPDL